MLFLDNGIGCKFWKINYRTIKITSSKISSKVTLMSMARAWPLMKATEKTEETHFHLSVSKWYHKTSSRCCWTASAEISRSTEKSEETHKLSCLCSALPNTCPLAVLCGEHMKLPSQFCIHLFAEKPPSLSQGSDPNPANACRVPFTPWPTPRGLGNDVPTRLQPAWGNGVVQSSTTLQGALKRSTGLC